MGKGEASESVDAGVQKPLPTPCPLGTAPAPPLWMPGVGVPGTGESVNIGPNRWLGGGTQPFVTRMLAVGL